MPGLELVVVLCCATAVFFLVAAILERLGVTEAPCACSDCRAARAAHRDATRPY